MTLVHSWSLNGDLESSLQALTAYRNGRDWAKRQRDEAIRQANERATSTMILTTRLLAARAIR
jgi:hypothetical protein